MRRAPGDNVLQDQFKTVAAVLTSVWYKKTQKVSGTNQKSERQRPFGTGLVRHCPQGLFSPFFTFLRAIFFRPFRLSLAPTICPWVSEDAFEQLGLHYSGTQGVPDLLMSRLFIYCAWFDRCFQLKSEILKSNVYQGGCCNPFCTSLYIYFPNVVLYIIRFPISQREFKV